MFGRPQRISACECERVNEASLAMSLHLLNSQEVQDKIARAGGRADRLSKDPRPDAEKVESTPGDSNYIPVVVVPTGTTVRFVEHSNDVIHSFWVPELLFKRDVFPGNVINQFEVNVTQVGSYVGRCAELCGTYHSMMNFELRVVSPNDFKAYLAQRESGKTNAEALEAINQSPVAITTKPFDTRRGEGAPELPQASR